MPMHIYLEVNLIVVHGLIKFKLTNWCYSEKRIIEKFDVVDDDNDRLV